MARKLLGSLMSMFERKKLSDNDILIWAKTEYGRDWRYAYEYMIRSKGNTPPRADLTNRNFQGWV